MSMSARRSAGSSSRSRSSSLSGTSALTPPSSRNARSRSSCSVAKITLADSLRAASSAAARRPPTDQWLRGFPAEVDRTRAGLAGREEKARPAPKRAEPVNADSRQHEATRQLSPAGLGSREHLGLLDQSARVCKLAFRFEVEHRRDRRYVFQEGRPRGVEVAGVELDSRKSG